MAKRINLKKLTQKVEESKGTSSSAKSTPAAKGVVFQEKRPRGEVSDISPSWAKSKGKEALPQPAAKKAKTLATSNAPMIKGAKPAMAPREGTSANPGTTLGPEASMLGNPSMAEKILAGVILHANKEKVDKLSLDQVVTKFFHIIGQAIVLGSSLTVQSRDIGNEATFQITRAESVETKSQGSRPTVRIAL
ncbi:hypothetical protein Acr_10g0008280 [Actinidia rufa]|uniref:Uncharacterized protein n=1 Tax=Actinidia rufa TaxID=165716 RepID=A0A7J0FA01_9ERIC|nr:hypothetical protein Acr_10g0008280 [Actinidia rufa]